MQMGRKADWRSACHGYKQLRVEYALWQSIIEDNALQIIQGHKWRRSDFGKLLALNINQV